jgi:hypothetical protein
MFDADAIDFREPVALFPLPTVSLLPHALQPLHVFEPRYRQMVEDALGSSAAGDFEHAAPIAMATFAGDAWRTEYSGAPALRPGAARRLTRLRGCGHTLRQGPHQFGQQGGGLAHQRAGPLPG